MIKISEQSILVMKSMREKLILVALGKRFYKTLLHSIQTKQRILINKN